ncbi:hypothetical protein [Actinacidiphila glaucinigra]|uniref:hypothetical protein n=1 Tax=Actinacidiphila glaucinigra TaxID=235986 RepID=UPI003D8A55B2
MMQHAHARIQAVPPAKTTSAQLEPSATPVDAPAARLVRAHADQEVATTTSRRVRRYDFLRAARWAIGAGYHPKASATTLRVAEDLAARMNADGHVAYGRARTAKRLGLSRRTVDRHVACLRELGLLAWSVHGSRTNTRRAAGLPGWAGTATIYAATAPPAWDHAMGHRILGCGYTARVVGYTCEGRERAISDARAAAARRQRDTPSCRQNPRRQKAKVGGNEKNTAARRQRAARSTSCLPHQAAHGVDVAAWVRPRVSWTQREQLRRLAFALRPLIVAGMSREAIVAELHSWWLTWRPNSPAAYITVRLRAAALTARLSPPEEAPAPVQGVPPNAAFRRARAQLHEDWPLGRTTGADGPSVPDEPADLIRSRILASLAQAEAAVRPRGPQDCTTLADWEALVDDRIRATGRAQ